jgi:Flp pilus assembly protein TadB
MLEVLIMFYVAGLLGGLLVGIAIGVAGVLIWAFLRRRKRQRRFADAIRQGNEEVDRWLAEIERERASSSSASSG